MHSSTRVFKKHRPESGSSMIRSLGEASVPIVEAGLGPITMSAFINRLNTSLLKGILACFDSLRHLPFQWIIEIPMNVTPLQIPLRCASRHNLPSFRISWISSKFLIRPARSMRRLAICISQTGDAYGLSLPNIYSHLWCENLAPFRKRPRRGLVLSVCTGMTALAFTPPTRCPTLSIGACPDACIWW